MSLDLDAISEREAERPYCSYIRSLRVILTPEERDALVGRIQELEAKLGAATTMLAEAERIVPGVITTAGDLGRDL